jgi:hypothetical protein
LVIVILVASAKLIVAGVIYDSTDLGNKLHHRFYYYMACNIYFDYAPDVFNGT